MVGEMYETLDFKRVDVARWGEAEYRQKVMQKLDSIRDANQKKYHEAIQKAADMRVFVANVWGWSSNAARYVRGLEVPKPPKFDKELRKLDRAYEALKQRQKRAAASKRYRERSVAAAQILESMGYVEGEHYKRGHAISTLKKLDVSAESFRE